MLVIKPIKLNHMISFHLSENLVFVISIYSNLFMNAFYVLPWEIVGSYPMHYIEQALPPHNDILIIVEVLC